MYKKEISEKKVAKKQLQQKAYIRGRTYSRLYSGLAKKQIHLARQAKSLGNIFVPAKPKVAIVIRIRGIQKVAPKQKKVLQLLRLRQLFNAVFVKLNKSMVNLLRIVEPYIAYGYPSVKTVRSLLYRRGCLRVNKQRVKITDNEQVKSKFNKDSLICIEDLVHQVATCGKDFRTVTNALWPFKLAPPKGGMRQKRRHFIEGGDYGNRETLINKLIYRMV